jgi:kynureninase
MSNDLASAAGSAASRDECAALDRADPLAALRDEFVLPDGVTYLDGNSLGALPRATAARLAEVAEREWGQGLIRSWNSAGWIDLWRRIGDKIAGLVGARAGEVSVGDSTSLNCFKALSAATALQRLDAPRRRVILSERDNFPTDLYIAESVAESMGCALRLVDGTRVSEHLSDDVGVLMLTHVNYRTGRMHRLVETTRAAHAAGALVVWDLAHSAGAVPVDLHGADADFAIGCGYKYLNGGPGAPAFVWAHPRHTARMDREQLRQPLSGWLGHAAPFEFAPAYRPAPGIARFVCGTPPVLAMAALECGLDVFARAAERGGVTALRAKSIALTDLFIELVEARCAGLGLALVTPRAGAERGSQVSFAHGAGYPVMQALIERGVIGDFRAGEPTGAGEDERATNGDLLRFGFTPLYTRFVDAWDAVEQLRDVLASGAYRDPRFARRAAVT